MDMENLFGGAKGDVTSVPIATIVADVERLARDLGVGSLTALVRAYANWGRTDMAVYRRELLANGVEPVQIFSFNQDVKNAADIEMVVDVLEVAAEAPWVDVFVIVSGDGGFVPLIRRLHTLGKYVIVVTTSHSAAGGGNMFLKAAADHFHEVQVPEPNKKPTVGDTTVAVSRPAPQFVVKPVPKISTKTVTKPAVKPATRPVLKTVTKPVTKPAVKPVTRPVLKTVAKPVTKQTVKPVTGTTGRARPADVPAVPRGPSAKDYQESVHALVRKHPDVMVEGLVHGSRLGALLRERWPGYSHKDFGYSGLERFIQERCGLTPYRPPASEKTRAAGKELVRAGS